VLPSCCGAVRFLEFEALWIDAFTSNKNLYRDEKKIENSGFFSHESVANDSISKKTNCFCGFPIDADR
jgi:hypothetical protein